LLWFGAVSHATSNSPSSDGLVLGGAYGVPTGARTAAAATTSPSIETQAPPARARRNAIPLASRTLRA